MAYACTTAQIDAFLDRGGSSADYSTPIKEAARDVATSAFEQKANRAIAATSVTEIHDAVSGYDLYVKNPRPLSVTALTLGGVTADHTAVSVITDRGVVFRPLGWDVTASSAEGGGWRRAISITYTHGYSTVPADLSNAIALLAASLVKDGPFDDRGYMVTDDGGAVRLLTAGVGRASFSIPEVQAALNRYRVPALA